SVGEFSYPLESVIKLKKLMDEDISPDKLCKSIKLPEEFYPVCDKEDAADVFIKLGIFINLDMCCMCQLH
uniref:Guanylate cyclase activator 2B n=1 Tax=Leptobrachium leishanense TaxID=445787 RepID=A0A8C5MWR6_9ANUR